ncbi:MAG: DUF4160 domain-containing protein [Betaproteobacteria bacterium]|nr:DUF4160 domain-containing protein [Betaproteobacteria bacterium]
MPTIQRLSRSKICIYAADHLPPHFHIVANDGREMLVEIATLATLAGTIGKSAKTEALAWAEANQDTLYEKWMELNNE